MLYKINFRITAISQQAYIIIAKHIDSIKEGFVIALTKEKFNTITTILEDEKVPFSIEEIPEAQTQK